MPRTWAARVLWVAVIATVIALVYGAEVLSENVRLRSGPSAWYAVRSITVTMRDDVTYHTNVVGGPFTSQASCENDIVARKERNSLLRMGRLPRIRKYTTYWCRRMLESDVRR